MYKYVYIYIYTELGGLLRCAFILGPAEVLQSQQHDCINVHGSPAMSAPVLECRFATQSRVSVRICSMARLTYAVHRPRPS